ncbi:YbhQ family protein, partial [Klebsiella pneumoniae]|uniref:YbhQ family protein n=1 Tax=Klebsiella pneumoniae TaxID=573 RepID=UPI00210E2FDA
YFSYPRGGEHNAYRVLYSVTLLAMLFLQRHHEARWRDVGDFLEELTTTFYSQIFRQPVGRHVIRYCDSVVCHITGYQACVWPAVCSAREVESRFD